jgi:hypothetical protein
MKGGCPSCPCKFPNALAITARSPFAPAARLPAWPVPPSAAIQGAIVGSVSYHRQRHGGVACLENILSHNHKFDITIFGDETHVNYNRILLSSVLAGERAADEITINGIDWYQKNGIGLRLGVRIIDVNTQLRTLTGEDGGVTRYDKLIFATGSSAFIPPMDGIYRRNVFTFRSMDFPHGWFSAATIGPGMKATPEAATNPTRRIATC